MENEKLQRASEQEKDRDRIELDFEMTQEQKDTEQSISFGAQKQPFKLATRDDMLPTNMLGGGLNSLQHQTDLMKFGKQGQQGIQSSPAAALNS